VQVKPYARRSARKFEASIFQRGLVYPKADVHDAHQLRAGGFSDSVSVGEERRGVLGQPVRDAPGNLGRLAE
jgi:hypothetical protein